TNRNESKDRRVTLRQTACGPGICGSGRTRYKQALRPTSAGRRKEKFVDCRRGGDRGAFDLREIHSNRFSPAFVTTRSFAESAYRKKSDRNLRSIARCHNRLRRSLRQGATSFLLLILANASELPVQKVAK